MAENRIFTAPKTNETVNDLLHNIGYFVEKKAGGYETQNRIFREFPESESDGGKLYHIGILFEKWADNIQA